jgi:succinyl-CoA synthetase alpha subunit
MSILIDSATRVVVQDAGDPSDCFAVAGLPFHASAIVGYVARRGADRASAAVARLVDGAPRFASIAAAVRAAKVNASVVSGAADGAVDCVAAAVAAGVRLVVLATGPLSAAQRGRIAAIAAGTDTRLIAPGGAVVAPGACQIGSVSGYVFSRGRVGILSRAGSLTLEAALQTSAAGLGQSTVVDLGAEPIQRSAMADCLDLFLSDAETAAVVLIGAVDGEQESAAAAVLGARRAAKPVVAHLAGGFGAPSPGTGGAAAVVPITVAKAARKIDALRRAGAVIAMSPATIGSTVASVLAARGTRSAGRASDDFLAAMRQAERDVYDAG